MRQNQIAKDALKQIQLIKADAHAKEFKTLCMKTPALLQMSGLAQTVAFLRTRYKNTKTGERFIKMAIHCIPGQTKDVDKYQESVLKGNLTDYMEMTSELQDVLIWLRRFAQVELRDIQAAEDEHE